MSPSNPSNVTVLAHADMALAQRCASGDPGGFEELYRVYSPRLFGLACRMVGRTEAEDWLQEIFSARIARFAYKGESALGTWLFRMATNLCLDHLRSRANWTAQATDSIDADTVHQPEGQNGPHPRRDRSHRSRTGAG